MTLLVVTLISVVGGAICCFAGYKIFRAALAIIGGCLGAYLGIYLYRFLAGFEISFMHMEYSEIITVLWCAVLLAVLSFTLYMKALIAVVTLITTFYLFTDSKSLELRLPWNSPIITLLLCLLFGAVVGMAVYFLQKWAIIIFTSFIGAKIITSVLVPYLMALVAGNQGEMVLKMFTDSVSSNTEIAVGTCALLILTGAGIAVQASKNKS